MAATWTNSSAAECAEELLAMLHRYAAHAGCRHLCNSDSSKRPWLSRFYKAVFALSILIYLSGMIFIMYSLKPGPNVSFQLDTSTLFLLMWMFLQLDGLGCFITMNHAYRVLSRDGGFFDQCHELFNRSNMPCDPLRRCKRSTLMTIWYARILFMICFGISIPYVCGYLFEILPMKVDHSAELISAPVGVAKSILQIFALVSGVQASCHNIVFSGLCALTRYHFSHFNKTLNEETGETFTLRKICKKNKLRKNKEH
jgi:hypothetical protein